jgi:hypothetical protein
VAGRFSCGVVQCSAVQWGEVWCGGGVGGGGGGGTNRPFKRLSLEHSTEAAALG